MNNLERKKARRNRRIIRTLKRIGNIAFFSIAGLLILYFVISTIDINTNYSFSPFGLRSSVIVSESMAYRNPENTYLTEDMHQIQKNDLIITSNYKSYNDIKLYDVLTYKSGNVLICHRVVNTYEQDGKQFIVTRGDSNNADDTPIEYSSVKGKVIAVAPQLGAVALFLQSPYVTLAIFGSLFFFFLAWFIFSLGSYREYDKVIARDKRYEEDKTHVLNNEIYVNAKNKKEFELVGGDNHYQVKVKGDQLVLERYIRTDYKNKTDNIIVSGVYNDKELSETLILSVLPLAFDLMIDGLNPLKRIKEDLTEKGALSKELNEVKKINEEVIKIIKESGLSLDIDESSDKKLVKSYKSFLRYLSRKKMNNEGVDIIYSYVNYCIKNNIEPMEAFKEKEVMYA